MKITYEEFSELQTQQTIRNYAQETINTLNCLNNIVEEKHNEKITEMMNEVRAIEDEAIENIRKMIEGD